jgi:alginate O-acetyltransferase complex protein AlgI
MLFNSFAFIFAFLPTSFFIYFYLNGKKLIKLSRWFLLFSSLFFYSWWNYMYLPLILVSILVNYFVSNLLIDYQTSRNILPSKRAILYIGLAFNIGILAYFKYADFFINNANYLFTNSYELLNLALPLAISFFTLQQIAYLIDTYEGLVRERNLLDYSLFVTFFPQLIAGPIVHHREMMPQFYDLKNKVFSRNNVRKGLFIFNIGLFKKVVIADTLSIWAINGFDTSTTLSFFEAWGSSLAYTFQLYFDFSGYTDMAIGAALLFNIKLPANFNSPYKATGIIDFWQRWHITLTSFITIYIYTPIIRSFSKANFNKAMLATVITFLIAGLWHGASWMFVIFGGLHGLGLVMNHYWRKKKIKLNSVFSWFITFNFINIAFIFFRSKDLDTALMMIRGMTELGYLGVFDIINYSYVVLSFLIVLLMENTIKLSSIIDFKKINTKVLMFSLVLFSFSILQINAFSISGSNLEFLYFNF